MKRNYTIASLLGMTHKDMAGLLSISPSHYSMFESGKRDLPHTAQLLLSELLTSVESDTITAKSHDTASYEAERLRLTLYKLKENQFQQMVLERKMAAAERKHQAHLRRHKLLQSFAKGILKTNPGNNLYFKILSFKTTDGLEKKVVDLLVGYASDLEDLKVLEKSLESRLKTGY